MGLIIGLLWGLCAVLCIVKRDKINKRTEIKGIILGIGFGFFALCGLLGAILNHELLQATAVLLSVGILCIGAFVFAIYRVRNCNTQIWGTYITYQTYIGNKGYRSHAPIFRYSFGGVEYERPTNETYSLKKLNKKFSYGQTYPIWINEKAPEAYITKKSVQAGYVVTFLAGLLILVMYGVICIETIFG